MKRALLLAGGLFVLTTGVALATGGFGVLEAVIQARGTLDEGDPGHHVMIKLKDTSDLVVQKVRIGAGGHTGWHTHPGPAVVIVKSGERFTLYNADDPTCTGTAYSAGQAFVDPGHGNVHIGRNEGTNEVELWVTYFEVPVGGAFRIDVSPAPDNCPF